MVFRYKINNVGILGRFIVFYFMLFVSFMDPDLFISFFHSFWYYVFNNELKARLMDWTNEMDDFFDFRF